jgi:hypothetical protein
MGPRPLASHLVRELVEVAQDLVSFDDVDLAPALEQHLFLRFRGESPEAKGGVPKPGPADRFGALLTSVSPALRWAVARRQPALVNEPGRSGRGVALVLAAVHCRIWAPIGRVINRRGYAPLVIVRAARFRDAQTCAPSLDLSSFLRINRAARLARLELSRAGATSAVTRRWSEIVPEGHAESLWFGARRALSRLTAQAANLQGLVEQLHPPVLVAFSELSEWARVVSAVGRAHDIPTVDLPHAEAADPDRLRGLDYDRVGVFGSVAARVLRAADFPPERIVEIGAPHFDELVASPAREPVKPRRVVYASQFIGGLMTPGVKAATFRAAIAAAAAVGPAELVVKLHPLERDAVINEVLRHPLPADVSIRIVHSGGMREVLVGSWLLVTAWSNTVFEATLLAVPSLTVNATGLADPMGFAAEGMAVSATDAGSAAFEARRFLDPVWRSRVLSRAQRVLAAHLGPLDGRAAERATELILSTAGDRMPRGTA